MSLRAGAHELGPRIGTVRLRTYRQGIAARAGHDLVLEATAWRGNLDVPGDPDGPYSVTIEIDLPSIVVVGGSGGVKPLTDADREEIRRTMQKPLRVADHPIATFRSTDVRVEGDRATLHGELSIAGATRPVVLHASREEDGTVAAHAQLAQSTWGIKPYTGFLGALKLRDAVDVDVELRLHD